MRECIFTSERGRGSVIWWIKLILTHRGGIFRDSLSRASPWGTSLKLSGSRRLGVASGRAGGWAEVCLGWGGCGKQPGNRPSRFCGRCTIRSNIRGEANGACHEHLAKISFLKAKSGSGNLLLGSLQLAAIASI